MESTDKTDDTINICKYSQGQLCDSDKYDKRDRKAHQDNKIPHCLQCEKMFSSTGNLNKHIRAVHQGIKKFEYR